MKSKRSCRTGTGWPPGDVNPPGGLELLLPAVDDYGHQLERQRLLGRVLFIFLERIHRALAGGGVSGWVKNMASWTTMNGLKGWRGPTMSLL